MLIEQRFGGGIGLDIYAAPPALVEGICVRKPERVMRPYVDIKA
jgi:hypothetical protein